MGCTGDLISRRYEVSREQQDAWAARSHQRAAVAQESGAFNDEIVAVKVPQRGGSTLVFDRDETIRADTSREKLANLTPVFSANGTVTAGNAPGVNDGAAALMVMSQNEAVTRGIAPLARVVAYATSGIEPELVMMAPVEAVNIVLKKAGWDRDDVDLFELNEAFAVQSVAIIKELGIDAEKVNVNGGAVALGHPIGASGARILTTLLHALTQRDVEKGIAAMCMGGGNGVAVAVERMS
jgi:acetyl-CoA C-acetyltransferase